MHCRKRQFEAASRVAAELAVALRDRFGSYYATRDFADENGISFEARRDMWPSTGAVTSTPQPYTKKWTGVSLRDSQLQMHISSLGLALKPVGRMGGAPRRKRNKRGGIGGGISRLVCRNIVLIQCDKWLL